MITQSILLLIIRSLARGSSQLATKYFTFLRGEICLGVKRDQENVAYGYVAVAARNVSLFWTTMDAICDRCRKQRGIVSRVYRN